MADPLIRRLLPAALCGLLLLNLSPAGAATPAEAAAKPNATAAAEKPTVAKKPVLIPGTGVLIKNGGDDFEAENWKWYHRHPKSSEEQDKRMRSPLGKSNNGLWFEGPKRGTPDVVKRIELPAPGLEGSSHGMLIATLRAGIPGKLTYRMMQDDLIFNMSQAAGRGLSRVDSPSVVTRVYLPPFSQWERRSGCTTHAIITGEDHPDRGEFGVEEYWPGMFIVFAPGDGKEQADSAYLRIRGDRRGRGMRGPTITADQLGWWTLGMSFSPDGMVHYFASPGVDELSMDDHMTSQYPYGYRTEWVKTFFYNVCSHDDGKTWSTPWVVDDPKTYFVRRQNMAGSGQPSQRSRR
jgi:hypothetical protein